MVKHKKKVSIKTRKHKEQFMAQAPKMLKAFKLMHAKRLRESNPRYIERKSCMRCTNPVIVRPFKVPCKKGTKHCGKDGGRVVKGHTRTCPSKRR